MTSSLNIETGLSSSMEDYMEAIIILSLRNRIVRVKDIANNLKIKMPSVTSALNKLREMELIDYEKYGYIELTYRGKEIAEIVYSRHQCLAEYYETVLMLDKDLAQSEACRVEHDLTSGTHRQIKRLLEFIKTEESQGSDWVKRFRLAMKD